MNDRKPLSVELGGAGTFAVEFVCYVPGCTRGASTTVRGSKACWAHATLARQGAQIEHIAYEMIPLFPPGTGSTPEWKDEYERRISQELGPEGMKLREEAREELRR